MTGESSQPIERRPLDDLQPSQLLVSREKLRDVLAWWDADEPEPTPASGVDPLPYLDPVDDLGRDGGEDGSPSRLVLADGHTRALAAVLSGVESLPVVRDPDRDELSMSTYRTCVGWCVTAGVRTPNDLVGRVVSPERHREAWVERCRALGDAEPAPTDRRQR